MSPLRLFLLPVLLATLLGGCATRGFTPVGWSGIAQATDLLYVGTGPGRVLALEAQDGKERWSYPPGQEKLGAIYAPLSATEDSVYVASYTDKKLHALDAKSGAQRWQFPTQGNLVGGPVVADGLVLLGSSDGNVYALDAKDGGKVWQSQPGGRVWSTPAVQDGVVYYSTLDHQVNALSLKDGESLWSFPTRGAVVARPLAVREKVFVGSFDRVFYALDGRTGRELWRFQAQNWFWAPAVSDGSTVYAGALDGILYAWELATGKLRWQVKTSGPIIAAPLLVPRGIAVVTDGGRFHLLRLRDGREEWVFDLGTAVRTNPVAKGETVYATALDKKSKTWKVWSLNTERSTVQIFDLGAVK